MFMVLLGFDVCWNLVGVEVMIGMVIIVVVVEGCIDVGAVIWLVLFSVMFGVCWFVVVGLLVVTMIVVVGFDEGVGWFGARVLVSCVVWVDVLYEVSMLVVVSIVTCLSCRIIV